MFSLVPASNVALIVEGLCKTYGKTVAVGPLSFSLTLGSTTGLLGGNGAGKTTTIGMIMGLIEPMSGSIHALANLAALKDYGLPILVGVSRNTSGIDL
jgi:ABC-2 type transport system ATP-binding protein